MDEIKTDELKKHYISVLGEMVKRLDEIPDHAMMEPLTNYDLYAILCLMQQFLKLL